MTAVSVSDIAKMTSLRNLKLKRRAREDFLARLAIRHNEMLWEKRFEEGWMIHACGGSLAEEIRTWEGNRVEE